MWETLLDALVDTLKVLPLLFIVYMLLEFLEYRGVMKFEHSKFLKGKASPVFGSLFGCVPQCGFSVISTDLYSEKKISIGALIAVYVATSDEAIPIMIAEVDAIPQMLLLIAVKIVMGIVIGYLAMFLYGKIFKNNENAVTVSAENLKSSEKVNTENHEHDELKTEEHKHISHGCCKHDLEQQRFDWLHPILHCLKISAFILIVNIILGVAIYYITEERLIAFLEKSSAFQPLFAVIIGLIPNCVSSLVITELYLAGGLSFGSIIAGLSVNAGLGLVVLFKQNKNWKENLFIILMLIIPSLFIGYGIHLLF